MEEQVAGKKRQLLRNTIHAPDAAEALMFTDETIDHLPQGCSCNEALYPILYLER